VTDSSAALSDVRVIEAGQLIAGPFAGQLLGDLGADVIKIEPPGDGDPMRKWGHGAAENPVWWHVIARNKRSVTLDLRHDEGQELMRRLIAQADVFIENFRPGTMERWGLGWDELSARNPRLVMVRITGFGQTGPYANRPGYGSIGEAMGGLRYVTGDPGAPPSRAGISIGDTLAATFATIGTLAALHARERTGRGQVVDSAIYEAVLAVMEAMLPEYTVSGHIRERTGAILPSVAPSNMYPTADGALVLVAANQDTVFRRLADAMGQPELAEPDAFGTHVARGDRQGELDDLIAAWTATLTTSELEVRLVAASVPVGRIYRAPELLADPHVAARDAIVRLMHPDLGELPMQNVVPRLSDTPGSIRSLGPELGEHTEAVLRELLGLDAIELERLSRDGVV